MKCILCNFKGKRTHEDFERHIRIVHRMSIETYKQDASKKRGELVSLRSLREVLVKSGFLILAVSIFAAGKGY